MRSLAGRTWFVMNALGGSGYPRIEGVRFSEPREHLVCITFSRRVKFFLYLAIPGWMGALLLAGGIMALDLPRPTSGEWGVYTLSMILFTIGACLVVIPVIGILFQPVVLLDRDARVVHLCRRLGTLDIKRRTIGYADIVSVITQTFISHRGRTFTRYEISRLFIITASRRHKIENPGLVAVHYRALERFLLEEVR